MHYLLIKLHVLAVIQILIAEQTDMLEQTPVMMGIYGIFIELGLAQMQDYLNRLAAIMIFFN